jgi:predicted transcriptional regulator
VISRLFCALLPATVRHTEDTSKHDLNTIQYHKLTKDLPMSEEKNGNELFPLTEKIVSAHIANNAVPSADLPALIKTVYAALEDASTATKSPPTPEPFVPIKKSVTPNYLICLEDGKKLKMLKRHLNTAHNMTPDQYRQRWRLPPNYPMVAPHYAAQRSELAKKIGLGRKPKTVKPTVKTGAKK